jgi:ribonuclease VapC
MARALKTSAQGVSRLWRGRHDGRLNFGDCLAYALAKDASTPLLFKGDDLEDGRNGGAILKLAASDHL